MTEPIPVQGFSEHIYLKMAPGSKAIHLSKPFHYTDKGGRVHCAPEKMLTDGLSIPRFAWSIIGEPVRSRWLAAGLIHDMGCDLARHMHANGDKKEARALRKAYDELFLEMLLYLGCPKWKARTMYNAVRLGALKLG